MPQPSFTEESDVSKEYVPSESFLLILSLPLNTPITLHNIGVPAGIVDVEQKSLTVAYSPLVFSAICSLVILFPVAQSLHAATSANGAPALTQLPCVTAVSYLSPISI